MIRLESGQDFLSIPGVLLLESADQYDPEFLCIADPEISAVILKAQKSGCLITAGSSEELLRLSCPEQILLIVTDLSAITLNNLLNSMLFEKNRIQEELSSASPYQLSHLIRLAHQISNASFCNPGQQCSLSLRQHPSGGQSLFCSSDPEKEASVRAVPVLIRYIRLPGRSAPSF